MCLLSYSRHGDGMIVATATGGALIVTASILCRAVLLNGFVGAYETSAMKQELAARGVPPFDDDEQKVFAKRIAAKVEHMHPGKDKVGIWFKLFKEVRDRGCGAHAIDILPWMSCRGRAGRLSHDRPLVSLDWCGRAPRPRAPGGRRRERADHF